MKNQSDQYFKEKLPVFSTRRQKYYFLLIFKLKNLFVLHFRWSFFILYELNIFEMIIFAVHADQFV